MAYDVAIIGGGPTGSQVAYRLASAGYRVIVLEQKQNMREPVCCTGIISESCAREFAIDESIILRRVNSARVFSPSGREIRVTRSEPQACVVDRPSFNTFFASRAEGAGAEYVFGAQATGIGHSADSVNARMIHRGKETGLEARAVVVASGFGREITERAGLGRTGDFVMGAQMNVDAPHLDEVEVYTGRELAPAFFAWLVPSLPGKARLGLLARRDTGLYLKRLTSRLLSEGKITSNGAEPAYAGVPLKPLSRTYGDRLLVVGTAAGQIKPTTAGGIYYGLLCADMAAGVLGKALETDRLSARDLAVYQRMWRSRLGQEIRIGYAARKVYERLGDRQIDGIFDIIKSHGIEHTLAEASELSFDWHGPAVLRLLGHGALNKVLSAVRLPLALASKRKSNVAGGIG